ncbi:MAG: M81 family metallopeptidase [Alphaproteobacteria bacterium]
MGRNLSNPFTIAVGGFHHETNTFAPTKATFADFEAADGWPALTRGEAMLDAMEGMNLPIAGFVDTALAEGHRLAPLSWCSATPSAHVTREAFERIAGLLLEDLQAAPSVDAVYLDLHGAMVTEHLQDGEGALLERLRAQVGPDMPILVSLDFHANVTEAMVKYSDIIVGYRTYPHIDMAETGRRTALLLDRLLRGERPRGAFRQIDYLMPLVWQCTDLDPAKGLYAAVAEAERAEAALWSTSLLAGFPPADIHDVGPSVLVYADDQPTADRTADALAAQAQAAESAFAGTLYTPDEAVRYAMTQGRRPVVIADSQDNPGAGGNSDTVGMLRALIDADAQNAVLALLYDPEVAAKAHAAGEGADIEVALGAKAPWQGEQPYRGRFHVDRLADGNFTATGPMFIGSRMRLGPMAVLRIGGVEIIVSSKKIQAADLSMFRHVGIEPASRDILVVKSSVHFRADFAPMAGEIIVAAAPGPNVADYNGLDYKNVRPGVRLMPNTSTA